MNDDSSPSCPLPSRQDSDRIRSILEESKTIAVVGMSSKASRPSREVGLYLRDRGYEILPIHPREREIEGMPVLPNLESIPTDRRVDVVDLFISGEKTLAVVEQAARIGVRVLWFQPGAEYEPAERRARELGLEVVSGRCALAEHRRLLGR